MKPIVAFLVLAGLMTGCTGEPPIGPEAPDAVAVQVASQSLQPKEYWFADFFTPLVPAFYGLRTYRDGDEEFTSRIIGEETVPYQTGN